MLKIEITGNTSDELYANAVTMLYMVTRGGQAIAAEREQAQRNVDIAKTTELAPQQETAAEVVAEPLANPKAADPQEKKTRAKKDKPVVDVTPTVVEDADPLGLGAVTAQPALTAEDMRQRVKDIIAADSKRFYAAIEADDVLSGDALQKARDEVLPQCIAYIRKLFAPFGVQLAADVKPEDFAKFLEISQAYLDGTAPR